MDTDLPPPGADAPSYTALATMWQTYDPAPSDLAEQVLIALEMEDLDAEYELLHLTERSRALAGTRAAETCTENETLTIVFSGASCSLMMRVSPLDDGHRRVDGWVSPPRQVHITLKQQSGTVDTASDARGRFEVDRMPIGMTRAVLTEADAAESTEEQTFATPAFEL